MSEPDLARRSFLRSISTVGVGTFLAAKTSASQTTKPAQPVEGVFELGKVALRSGTILSSAKLAFKTHGQLNAERNNAILYPTPFGANHGDIEWLIGSGRALDPKKYFIIVSDQLGNGLSSSPSNTARPYDRMRFPNAWQDMVTLRVISGAALSFLLDSVPVTPSFRTLGQPFSFFMVY
ncbi:MAG: hypothetical protein HY650_06165 [Acidobacteria bacterium]|nr:hypothetical protein [Acidobacteriota bacterium]